MFSYNITSTPIFTINTNTIDSIFTCISNIVSIKQLWTLNIVFLDPNSIKNLNKEYRWIEKVTDVLSFHYYDDFSNLKKDEVSWEIIMCEKKIISQWKEYKLWSEKEFYKLLIHSIIHILGYDHEIEKDYKEMNVIEKNIWKEVFEK